MQGRRKGGEKGEGRRDVLMKGFVIADTVTPPMSIVPTPYWAMRVPAVSSAYVCMLCPHALCVCD
jgi:hypothetical protein